MKKNMFICALTLLLFASCNPTEASSNSNLNSSSLNSFEESTNSLTGSSSSESSSTPAPDGEMKHLLSYLKDGFAVQTIYSKSYEDSSNPTKQFMKSYVGKDVLLSEKYMGAKTSFDDEETYLYQSYQYEKGDEDQGLIYQVSYADLSGKLKKDLVQLEDPLTEQDFSMTYDESPLVNAFSKLKETDFIKTDDYYTLDVSETKLQDTDYVKTINTISAQFFPYIDGYVSHYFLKQDLVSLKIKVDGTNKPLSYELDLGKSESYGSISYHKMEGDFIGFGSEVATKLTTPKGKYEEFDAKIQALQGQNYEFFVRRSHTADSDGWSEAGDDTRAYGVSDGKYTFEVTDLLKNSSYGYKQVDDTHYKKYTISGSEKTSAGDAVEGKISEKFLPPFALSSSFFEKVEGSNEYHYVASQLISNPKMDTHYLGYDLSYGNYVVINHLTVTINSDSISIYNHHDSSFGDYFCEITFYNIGGVKEITANIN